MATIEHDIQRSVVTWFRLQYRSLSVLFFAVPNGQRRSCYEQREKKAEGIVAGVADMLLLVARQGYHGLCIEFKHDKTATSCRTYQTPEQKTWQHAVEAQGYRYELVRSFDEGKRIIEDYLNQKLYEHTRNLQETD